MYFCLEISFWPLPQDPHTPSLGVCFFIRLIFKNAFIFMHVYVGFTYVCRCTSIHVQARSGCHVYSFLGIYFIFETVSFDEPGAHCFG